MTRRCRGVTLAEMLIACAVLGIAAAVALPSAQPVFQYRADGAAGEVVQALRFAREEAMRSGAYRMLRCDAGQNQVSVYVPDTNGNVAAAVNYPLSKMNYSIVLGQAPSGSGAALTACSFSFADKTMASTLAFDANGNPVRGTGGGGSPAQALTSGVITLAAGGESRTIAVDVTGRVTSS